MLNSLTFSRCFYFKTKRKQFAGLYPGKPRRGSRMERRSRLRIPQTFEKTIQKFLGVPRGDFFKNHPLAAVG